MHNCLHSGLQPTFSLLPTSPPTMFPFSICRDETDTGISLDGNPASCLELAPFCAHHLTYTAIQAGNVLLAPRNSHSRHVAEACPRTCDACPTTGPTTAISTVSPTASPISGRAIEWVWTRGFRPGGWETISEDKGCEGNMQHIIAYFGDYGYTLESCKEKCVSLLSCEACTHKYTTCARTHMHACMHS